MAETQGFKARVEYEVTDGTQLLYTFPFSYLRKKFIKVDVLHADNSITSLTYGVDYVVNDLSLTLTNTAKVGEHLIIYRQTTTDKIITWNDGSILLASDMNTEDVQMLHLQEEQQDYIQSHSMNTKNDSDTKEVLWDAFNHRVVNVRDPKDSQDAVTKHYMESVQDGFVARNTSLLEQTTTQATNAKNSASSSATSASQSASSASASETSNQSAKKWAESTDSPDNQTDTDSTTGKTQSSRSWALYAKYRASASASSATFASEKATTATEQATIATSKASEASATYTNVKVSEANAKTSETNAKASERAASASQTAAKTSETNAKYYKDSLSKLSFDVTQLNNFISGTYSNLIKRNTHYDVGDVLQTPSLPPGYIIVVTTAGTTASNEPDWSTIKSKITDGTVTYIVTKSGGVLSGTVTAFSGTFENGYPVDKNTGLVDKEWHLCDGSKGTPDLRNRFIYGSDGTNEGATGGTAEETITIEQMPSHGHASRHNFTQDNVITYDRNVNMFARSATTWANKGQEWYSTSDTNPVQHTGGNQPHNNMPPYYVLAFIMKL